MTCIGFVGGLIAAVGAILCTSSNQGGALFLNEAVSVIILLIPAIVTLFMYNFSMSCRRSALFRGYIQYLEGRLNEVLRDRDMMYSKFLIPQYYAKYAVNKLGPAAMIIFLCILYFFSFYISIFFACRNENAGFLSVYKWGAAVLFVFSFLFNVMYVISLMRNDIVIKEVKRACWEYRG